MTSEQLQALGIDQKWLEPLNATFAKYDINTSKRQAAFIGQCGHESNSFKVLEENLHYSAKGLMATWPSRFDQATAEKLANNPEAIANKVYGGRADLGNTQDGDGWRYHGRGLIQLTGRNNYQVCGDALGQPFASEPSLLLEPMWACMSAGWFFNKKNLNALAESEDWTTMTKRINGGTLGLNDRIERIHKAMDVLGA
ncbi:COG3179 Predicted chitinase [uncultured Caudovirales phage]|uniref:COG3179 Predicted chitinase n=1 Tax=uncultured Caudovirales phage TaxID=2100421 RepID=A0A6J7WI77_9CAUD|nr:COG3179 Predicted chitinase [uncultured Caudovirales phage]